MERLQYVKGTIVDVVNRRVFGGEIRIENGMIQSIVEAKDITHTSGPYILPGFVDAHIHVESSMLPPSEFARLATIHGTVATVSDPHEIANVLGVSGVDYMINDGRNVPITFIWGAPSCVPATTFETAGAILDSVAVAQLLDRPEIKYLSEVMNFPGVIHGDAEVLAKIKASHQRKKPVDGHAPGLMGDELKKYISAGISTDHESYMLEEAREKLALGMKIIIREGSAAKNFAALHPILKDSASMCMFGSDDKHPNDLVVGHINAVVARAVKLGYDLMDILTVACVNPVRHYGIRIGLLQRGDPADFVIVEDLKEFKVLKTVLKGRVVARDGKPQIPRRKSAIVNQFNIGQIDAGVFTIGSGSENVRVIEALDGQLITNSITGKPKIENGNVLSDPDQDLLKIVVVNRYKRAKPAIGFIKNFGLKHGAIASSVAHDSHNVVAVGADDNMIAKAVNLIIEEKGGVAAVSETIEEILPLGIAGLMSDQDGFEVGRSYTKVDALAKELGSTLTAPFMTLSFMALPVIPTLKMTDRGLFDVAIFSHVDLPVK